MEHLVYDVVVYCALLRAALKNRFDATATGAEHADGDGESDPDPDGKDEQPQCFSQLKQLLSFPSFSVCVCLLKVSDYWIVLLLLY